MTMKVSALAAAIGSALALDEAGIAKVRIAIDKAKDAASGELEKKDQPTAKDGEGDNPEGKPKAKDGKAKDKDCAEGAVDEDKDEDKAKDEFPEKDDKAKDGDMDVDGEDEDNGGLSKADTSTAGGKKYAKPAQDTAKIVADALAARDALHEARQAVASTIGRVALDSAEAVYAAALKKLGVATDGVHPSAFKALFEVARDKANAAAPRAVVGDSAPAASMVSGIPGYGRLK